MNEPDWTGHGSILALVSRLSRLPSGALVEAQTAERVARWAGADLPPRDVWTVGALDLALQILAFASLAELHQRALATTREIARADLPSPRSKPELRP